jgi:lipopolysaccharide transport system ATP-binding protein
MSSECILVSARSLKKSYQIYSSPRARLMQFLVPRVQRWLGFQESSYFQDFHALQDVSLTVRRGETVGILGRNGSGKSTLLQLICGTLSPSQGEVVTSGRVAALLELGSGFNPEFTGRENVHLNGALMGFTRKQVDERFDAIARFADIGGFIDQPTKTYSSGMVVRLAFATAIHVDPDLLVIDEALAVGDTAFQQKCLNRIRQMQRNGVSILLVTHSTNTVAEYCDRAIYLKRGRMVADGACREIVKLYADDMVEEEGGIVLPLVDAAPGQHLAAGTGGAQLQAEPAEPPVASGPVYIVGATIVDAVGRPVCAVEHGQRIRIRLDVLAKEFVASPCFGIQILSPDGISLWSASTQSLNASIGPMPTGRHELSWELTANFGQNRYIVAIGVGILTNGEYKRYHRLDYAGHFDVLARPHSGAGWLAPLPEVRVSYEEPVVGGE